MIVTLPLLLTGLLEMLQEADFVCRTRTDDELDAEDNIISRKFAQVVFLHKEAIRFGQRFVSGKVLIVRMPLLVGVGITNSAKPFLSLSAIVLAETAESYIFFL